MRFILILLVLFFGCGPRGEQGKNGSAGIDGKNGADGSVGPAGLPGSNGATGPQGSPGINATPVTVITLCPGVTTYPEVFVEVALCINHTLYGVYSIPGAFLTELPPGNYTSAGIGSACNLTVSSNCVITH